MRLTTVLFVLIAIATTSSCIEMEKINGDYEITLVGSNDYSEHDITLKIETGDENKVSGKSACNQYSGSFTNPKSNHIEIGMLMGTKMYCMDLAEIEADYKKHLSQAASVEVTKTGINLLNKAGNTIIVAIKKETN
ncbi:MAG: heat shock protein HslJ [Rubritalea sp.]|jgi:heat shock protein HslJ